MLLKIERSIHLEKTPEQILKREFSIIDDLIEYCSQSSDFCEYPLNSNSSIYISYFKTLIDENKAHENLTSNIQENIKKIKNLKDILNFVPVEGTKITSNLNEIKDKLLHGSILIRFKYSNHCGILVDLFSDVQGNRTQNDAENEYSVIGPKLGFVENIDTNLHLLRRSLYIPNLKFEEFIVGTSSRSRVIIAYIEGITNPEHVYTARQRIKGVNYDLICDSSLLDQLITDNSNTPFPLFMSTERVDRVVYCLLNGQIAILSNGSPYVITAPTTIFDFFVSPEDYLLPWILGSFFRLIRFFGVAFSITATPLYVAILTYHHTIIPKDMLGPIINSRANVPFPPFIEAIILEFIIELLREAGARLPTKVGQTLGIVGGIVIGQATVQAALTSNILLIIVALSALASFTTPTFKMSNTIRFLRFPLIVLASIFGGFGIAAGLLVLFAHTLRLKSLGIPYLVPLFPFRYKEFSDGFIRAPLPYINQRRSFFRPLFLSRFKKNVDKDVVDHFNSE